MRQTTKQRSHLAKPYLNPAKQPNAAARASLPIPTMSKSGPERTSADAPFDGVIRSHMQEMLLETSPDGTERINRINYEICALQVLRDRLRCKEIWVEGAARYRNPDDDLPPDFTQ